MKIHSGKFFSYAFWLVMVSSAMLLAACGGDGTTTTTSTTTTSSASSDNSLVVNASVAGTMELDGTTWDETCHDRNPGEWVTSTMNLGATGTRTGNTYSDSTCTTLISTETFDLEITADGDQTDVTFANGDTGLPAAAPEGVSEPVTATRVTISGTDESGPWSFKTTMFVNDNPTPAVLMFGIEDSSFSVFDADGYPTTMWDGGPEQVQ